MSSSNQRSNGSSSTITLKSFAELANIIDLDALPPGPPDDEADASSSAILDTPTTNATSDPDACEKPAPVSLQILDLADVIAQLADVSSDLETMARADARARERATIELAQYETLAAERQQAERALAEARSVRATAELLVSEAFTEQARADAARHAAVARAAELTCTQLLAERVRASDELASRPHLARVLTERRQRERDEAQAAQRAESERATRLAAGIAAAKQAHREGRLVDARDLLASLAHDFPTSEEIQSVLNAVRWQAQHLQTAPAEEALSDVMRRPYRDDPEASVRRLAAVDMDGLPEDLARRIFGIWSNNCLKLVRHVGMHDPRRHSPARSRGLVFARRTPEGPYTVVSFLALTGWKVGDEVKDQRLIDASRPLLDR
jgi:hypothetical protein